MLSKIIWTKPSKGEINEECISLDQWVNVHKQVLWHFKKAHAFNNNFIALIFIIKKIILWLTKP